MKNFLLSLRFVIKRVFRLIAANIAWLICFAAVIAALTVVMAAVTEIRGSEDYPFYLATEPFLTVFLSFGLSSLYSDIYASVYIRTSGLYKCLRTRAVQVFLLMISVAAQIPAVIVTAVVNPLRSARLFACIGNNNRHQSAAFIGLFPHVDGLLRILDIQLTVVLFRGRIYGRRLCVYADRAFRQSACCGIACSGDTACRPYSFIYRVGYYFPHKKASS